MSSVPIIISPSTSISTIFIVLPIMSVILISGFSSPSSFSYLILNDSLAGFGYILISPSSNPPSSVVNISMLPHTASALPVVYTASTQ